MPNSIDQMRMLTGQRGADRSRMREAFTELTGADPVTGLSILDLCLPFAGDMGEGTWQTGTGIRMDEVIVEVTCAVNPAAVWKHLLDCTADQTFTTVKGNKGTAANVGDVLMQNEQLQTLQEGRLGPLAPAAEDDLPLRGPPFAQEERPLIATA